MEIMNFDAEMFGVGGGGSLRLDGISESDHIMSYVTCRLGVWQEGVEVV